MRALHDGCYGREALAVPVVHDVRKNRQHKLFGRRRPRHELVYPVGIFEAHYAPFAAFGRLADFFAPLNGGRAAGLRPTASETPDSITYILPHEYLLFKN